MIVEEKLSDRLVKHSSDKGVMMLQKETGILYAEAVDVIPCRYTYEETKIPVEEEPYGN